MSNLAPACQVVKLLVVDADGLAPRRLARRRQACQHSRVPLLDKATVLITGASSGLGAEFARQLAPHANCLILAARRVDRLLELAKQIERDGLTIHCLAVDLFDAADTARFLGELRSLNAPVSIVINNAGLGDHGLFENSEWSRVDAMIQVNITALTRLTLALLPALIAGGRGGILNVASIVGLLPVPQMAVYSATKAYVVSLSESLRCELRGTGVSVLAFCPGPMDTEFNALAKRSRPVNAGPGGNPSSSEAKKAPVLMKTSPAQAVRTALSALEKDRPRVIPGWRVRAVLTAAVLTPMFIKRFFLNRRGRRFTGH